MTHFDSATGKSPVADHATLTEIRSVNYISNAALFRAADRRPQTADRRPQTADRRPQTALTYYFSIAVFLAIALMIPFQPIFSQVCTSNSTRTSETPCYLSCTQGLLYSLGPLPVGPLCNSSLGDGLRLHSNITPGPGNENIGYEPMPTIRFSYHKDLQIDCSFERAGRIGIMPPFADNGTAARLYPVSVGNFGEGDVFLVSTCDAKDLLLSTNNVGSRIKFLTTSTQGTQAERMTIASDGDVGIRTSNPLAALQIYQKLTLHYGANEYLMGYNQYQTGAGVFSRIMESSTMGIMFKEDHNMMYITNNGHGLMGSSVNYREVTNAVKGITIGNDNVDVASNGDKAYIGLGSSWDPNSRVVIQGLSESSAVTNALRVTNNAGSPVTRFVVKDVGTVGIRTDVVKNDFQINDMFGIHAGGTSVIAHNAYTYYDAATSTWKWKRMVDGVGNDKRPAALGLWNGTLSVQVAGEGLAESPITWNTALSIANDGKVAISSLAATGDPRPVYVNSSGELIDGSTGTLTSWGLNGNTGTTSSNFIGTTTGSNQPLIFKSNGVQRMKIFGGTSTDNNTYIQIGTTYFNPSSTGQELPTGLTCRVSVDGQIVAKEYLCKAATWSDFVFHENYNLRSLDDVETYIKENGHLPEIPSETEVQDQGINLAEIQAKLLQKVEELTLYMIDLKRQNDILSHEVQILKQNQKK